MNRVGISLLGSKDLSGILRTKWQVLKGINTTSRKIFIVGTGRSGTHLLAHILLGHPSIAGTLERPWIFKLSTAIALDPEKKAKLLPRLILIYRIEHARVAPRHYCDKSHPNLWIAEELAGVFPEAYFIAIKRNPYAVVASMLKHAGVLRWHHQWRRFPVPNPFLGINDENAAEYDNLSLPAKCALRWVSHMQRIEYLRNILGNRLLVISYEDLVINTRDVLQRLAAFLNLESKILSYNIIRRDSVSKWKTELAPQEVADVSFILERYGYKPCDFQGDG